MFVMALQLDGRRTTNLNLSISNHIIKSAAASGGVATTVNRYISQTI